MYNMKNLEKLSVIELNQSELANTRGGFYPILRAAAYLAYWTWDNWDELKAAADGQVSDTIY